MAALPPVPKELRSVGLKPEPAARVVDEWARGTQALTLTLRRDSIAHAARLTTVEAGLVTLNAEVDALALAAPTLHASTHASGGTDPIKLDDLAAPDDNTDLNASTTAHGLLRKLSGNASEVLLGDGTFGASPGGGVAIGDTVTGGTSGSLLYVGAAGALAQDNANLYYNYSSGFLGLGTTGPETKLEVDDGRLTTRAYGENGSVLQYRAGGSKAAPTQVVAESILGGFVARGWTSAAAWSSGYATVEMYAEQSFTASAQGSRIQFGTTRNGTTSTAEVARISNRGNLILRGASATVYEPASAVGALVLLNATAPTGAATDGSILYAGDSGGSSRLWRRNESTAAALVTGQDQVLTQGRVPYATTDDRLTDSANLTYNGTSFKVGPSSATATICAYVGSGAPLPALFLEDGDVTATNWSGVGYNPAPTTRTVAALASASGGTGGAVLYGFSNAAGGVAALLSGHVGATTVTAAANRVYAYKHDGASGRTALASGERVIDFYTGTTKLAELYGGAYWALYNGTAPSASVTDGILLYALDVAASSELRVRDEAGNVTTLSPHNRSFIPYPATHDLAWTYHSEQPSTGRAITCDMYEVVRAVEELAKRAHLPRDTFIFEGAVPTDAEMAAHAEAAAAVRRDFEAAERAAGRRQDAV